MPARSRPRPRA
uniref:Uncharacterized protein n=1 Tax=Anguilla anguilla TaxID=7936 RepID=A0A0E9UP04_ANGAN